MSGRKRQRRGGSEHRGSSRPSKHHSGRESMRNVVRTTKRGPKRDEYEKFSQNDQSQSELQPSQNEDDEENLLTHEL